MQTAQDVDSKWQKPDAQAQENIIQTIEKKVLVHIMNCKTSAEMYKKN